MTFVPSRLNEKRQSKGGLGIAIARTNSDDYLIAFYLDGIYDDRKNYKRCFPETNIRLLSKDRHKPHDKYDTIYKIANPPTFDASDLNSHYKPRIRDSQEYGNIVHTPFITGCWQISAAHLKTLEEEGKVLQSANMTILDPDEFFELAPRGIYSLNVHTFIPENDLRLPQFEFGDPKYHVSTYRDQRVLIRLSDGMIKLPEKPYQEVIDGIKRRGFRVTEDGNFQREIKYDVVDKSYSGGMQISFSGNPTTIALQDLFGWPSDGQLVQFLPSDSNNWVLGGKILNMLKISIDTTGDMKTYEITASIQRPKKKSTKRRRASTEGGTAGTSTRRRRQSNRQRTAQACDSEKEDGCVMDS
ncbi:unnamed protein product [Albugo candida]|uniref:Uncharacterized protein n=1 Tax=Albugo candida TaxID=65357 RepID=A0A024GK28_9STRA|nr:unnamed protein product [Albugo candida]|eukprot:CCI47123.1 unnamed protein product [Albugo candida]